MKTVAKKNTEPVEIYSVADDEVDQNFPTEDWLHDPEGYTTLAQQGVPAHHMKATDTDVVERDQADIDADALANAKAEKIGAVDARTEELISEGYSYNSKIFSLSRQAQSNLAGVKAAIADHRAAGTLAAFEAAFFPTTFNTIDDTDSQTIADVDEFQNFYDAAVGTVRTHLDGGTALKQAVRDAMTAAEVDAVVDDR